MRVLFLDEGSLCIPNRALNVLVRQEEVIAMRSSKVWTFLIGFTRINTMIAGK